MGHLSDVLHALLTADSVLTDITQWSSFPRASCFSLVAHTLATAPTAAAPTTMGMTLPTVAPGAATVHGSDETRLPDHDQRDHALQKFKLCRLTHGPRDASAVSAKRRCGPRALCAPYPLAGRACSCCAVLRTPL